MCRPASFLFIIIHHCKDPQGPGYMGLAAATLVPMGARVPRLSPNDDPNPSQGCWKIC